MTDRELRRYALTILTDRDVSDPIGGFLVKDGRLTLYGFLAVRGAERELAQCRREGMRWLNYDPRSEACLLADVRWATRGE